MNYISKIDFNQAFFSFISPSGHRIFEEMLNIGMNYAQITPAQQELGRRIGLSRKQVNQILGDMHRYGFIKKKARLVLKNGVYRQTTSQYTFSHWFYYCADELSHMFPVLKKLAFRASLSFGIKKVTPYKYTKTLVVPEEQFLSLPQPYYGYISLNLEPDEACFVSQGDILQKNRLPYDIRELIFGDNTKKG